MDRNLAFDLHALTARLDRSADRMLQAEYGLSYRRFLTLLMLGELGYSTQRALAERLSVSEPSVSRMISVLTASGLVHSPADPAGGNRRRLSLTADGSRLLGRCRDMLERRFADLVDHSGVPYAAYARHTRSLIAALDAAEGRASS